MSDNNNTSADVLRSLGRLEGTLDNLAKGLTANMQEIRADIRRLEDTSNAKMDRIEAVINRRMESIETRVTNLEEEDKKLIEKTAKVSGVGGAIGGALATAMVELIKRIS